MVEAVWTGGKGSGALSGQDLGADQHCRLCWSWEGRVIAFDLNTQVCMANPRTQNGLQEDSTYKSKIPAWLALVLQLITDHCASSYPPSPVRQEMFMVSYAKTTS